MSEQRIEKFISEIPNQTAQKYAFEFAAYLRANEMLFEKASGYWADKLYWMITYKGKYVCYILINSADDEGERWIIWSDDSDSNWFADVPLDDHLKKTAWKNIDICGNCGGCDRPGGSHKTIFGKDFDNVCRTTLRFVNPDVDALACAKKMVELRKNDIQMNLAST